MKIVFSVKLGSLAVLCLVSGFFFFLLLFFFSFCCLPSIPPDCRQKPTVPPECLQYLLSVDRSLIYLPNACNTSSLSAEVYSTSRTPAIPPLCRQKPREHPHRLSTSSLQSVAYCISQVLSSEAQSTFTMSAAPPHFLRGLLYLPTVVKSL